MQGRVETAHQIRYTGMGGKYNEFSQKSSLFNLKTLQYSNYLS